MRLLVSSTDQAFALPAESAVYSVGPRRQGTERGPVPGRRPTETAAGPPAGGCCSGCSSGWPARLGCGRLWGRHRRRRSRTWSPTARTCRCASRGSPRPTRTASSPSATCPSRSVAVRCWACSAQRRRQDDVPAHAHGPDPPDRGPDQHLGHAAGPGAPVLSRLGSFVEGTGLQPHLSGRDNLTLYWAATGRPAEDAHMDGGDQVAGLGRRSTSGCAATARGCGSGSRSPRRCSGCPTFWCSTSPPTGSTRRRSMPCARCCGPTRPPAAR